MHRAIVVGLAGLLALGGLPSLARAGDKGDNKVPAVLRFKMNSLAGTPVDLARYRGKVILIVNVASECGYTPQYEGLQALHAKYAGQGLAVLGIPSNDFGGQEPGTNEQIAAFCKKNYGVQFDMFAKVPVTGKDQAPLYRYLTSREANAKLAGPVRWNFEKFLIARDGTVVARFASDVEPESDELLRALWGELAKK
jgi:glutathione peroxidase